MALERQRGGLKMTKVEGGRAYDESSLNLPVPVQHFPLARQVPPALCPLTLLRQLRAKSLIAHILAHIRYVTLP